jgi:hypothetical protein
LSAYPPALRRPDLPPSNDPEGFDRIAFQAELAEQVGRFLDDTLPRS